MQCSLNLFSRFPARSSLAKWPAQINHKLTCLCSAALLSLFASPTLSAELQIGKVCPVRYESSSLGILAFSREWYHDSRSNAKYIPADNATGVGLEIHLFASVDGQITGLNRANCDHYRMLQVRTSNARLLAGESRTQIDIPSYFETPFYDEQPLEFGSGTHLTPQDDEDKPWQGRPTRASTLAIYDTPFMGDRLGVENEDIQVEFETCVVCSRATKFDTILSCGHWGYKREFIGGMSGWAEPEFLGVHCQDGPSERFKQALDHSTQVEYSYWLNWR